MLVGVGSQRMRVFRRLKLNDYQHSRCFFSEVLIAALEGLMPGKYIDEDRVVLAIGRGNGCFSVRYFVPKVQLR